MSNPPKLKPALHGFFAAALLSATTAFGQSTDLPDLAKLKLAAEGGDPVAQFNYSERISASNPKEHFSWLMRSAEQGYVPAQDAVGAHYDSAFISDPKKKQVAIREALAWTSRAAFQGHPASQLRLANSYDSGTGVAKDPVTAYMWTQIVIDNPDSSSGHRMMAAIHRDRIIANTSSENIREGQRRAAAFTYPDRNTLNPIEAELLYSELRLVGVFHLNGRTSAAVNNVRFYPGETKDVTVDEHTVRLTCVDIGDNFARFKFTGLKSEIVLILKR